MQPEFQITLIGRILTGPFIRMDQTPMADGRWQHAPKGDRQPLWCRNVILGPAKPDSFHKTSSRRMAMHISKATGIPFQSAVQITHLDQLSGSEAAPLGQRHAGRLCDGRMVTQPPPFAGFPQPLAKPPQKLT